MQVAGASAGFFIIYFFPITCHFKLLRMKKMTEKGHYEKLTEKENEMVLPNYIQDRKGTNFTLDYLFYGIVMAFGVFVLVIAALSIFDIEI